MSDENLDGEQPPPGVPAAPPPVTSFPVAPQPAAPPASAPASVPPAAAAGAGAFDWLQESHRHSAPLAPLTDDIPSPIRAGYPDAPPVPGVSGEGQAPFSDLLSTPTPPPPLAETPFPMDAPTTPVPPPVAAPPLVTPPAPDQQQWPLSAQAPAQPAAPLTAPAPFSTATAPLIPRPSFMTGSAAEAPTVLSPGPSAQAPDWLTAAPPSFVDPPQPTPQLSSAFATGAPTAPGSSTPPAPSAVVDPTAPAAGASASATTATSFPFAGLGAPEDDAAPHAFAAPVSGGVGPLGLERREPTRRSGNSPLDWLALVLAIVLPPIGLILAIVVLFLDSRSKGFAASITKAAVAIAVVLSIGVGVGAVVIAKLQADQAQQNAIAASSVAWCSKLTANPATLASSTYGWPAPANTVPESITSMQAYVKFWQSAVAIAPDGIKSGTRLIASNAKAIVKTVQSTQTLDDAADVSQMQSAVASSGIQNWVSQYCK